MFIIDSRKRQSKHCIKYIQQRVLALTLLMRIAPIGAMTFFMLLANERKDRSKINKQLQLNAQ